MTRDGVRRAIMVINGKFSPSAKQGLAEMAHDYVVEDFKEEQLLVDITEHDLVPLHTVLSEEEKEELLSRYKLKEAQLPRILSSDPVAKFYGMRHGQVVKITRDSETAGRYISYRVVV
jgi:DNA-directed RNA polymerase I, II, and III subunit RPABC1